MHATPEALLLVSCATRRYLQRCSLLLISFATCRYLQRRYGAHLASLAPSSPRAQEVWGAWHGASSQHHTLSGYDSAGGSQAAPPAESSAWQPFLLDLEPTDPEWDARQQGRLLLQGLLTSRYPAPGSFCLLPVAACSEPGLAAAGRAAPGSPGAGVPFSRAEGGPAAAPEHATLPPSSGTAVGRSIPAGPQAQLQRPPDLSGQGAPGREPPARAQGGPTAAKLLPEVAAVLGRLLMAEAGVLAGRSAALRLLAKHVENRGAALVHKAEDLALEVQRRRPVSMQQGVHELLCQGQRVACQQLLQPLHGTVRPQHAALAAQRAQTAQMCPRSRQFDLCWCSTQETCLEVQRQQQRSGEYMLRDLI